MSLNFDRPKRGAPASESSKLSMAELGGEEELEEGSEEELEEETPAFSEIEAMEMLEKLGYVISPPEGELEEGEYEDEGVSEPVNIQGSV